MSAMEAKDQSGSTSISGPGKVSERISEAVDYVTGINAPTKDPIVIVQHPMYDESRRMQAVELHGKAEIKIGERGTPIITQPGDAIIRVTTAAICGSDLHIYLKEVPGIHVTHRGDVLGHEGVGIIESVGPDVKKFKVGDRVVISAPISCGQCSFCKQGKTSLCDTTNPSGQMENLYGHRLTGVFGYTHLTGGYEGTQAEFVRVPIADFNLLRLPDTVPDDKAVFLSDVMCTGWHANELAEVKEGKTVCIWGAGPIGLMSCYLAKFRGASKVIIIDNDEFRLNMAQKSANADIALNFDKVKVLEEIKALIPGGPDCVIDATGFRFAKSLSHKIQRAIGLESDTPEVIVQAAMACKKGGNMGLIADYFAFANGFPIGHIMEKAITVRGGQLYAQSYWAYLLRQIELGKLDPSWMITHRLPLDHAAEGYKIFSNHEDECVKVLLKTKFAQDIGQALERPGRAGKMGA